ncbi:MAG: MBL fold metallo-hydrolase [Archaeoglobaceae archaeon]|nr:MBL fold metallo-hydrolase [Archaeoglobaceae archaeon]MCX8151697.1 MBL fold metallo-hydrolase [Archaeoglobaceae archaeon]MDW8013025.1 MBL fold metallo-hydrolase [Archaeoglobaceae archaeon]
MRLFDKIYSYIWGKAFLDCSNAYVIESDFVLLIDPGKLKSYSNLLGLMRNDKIRNVDFILNTHLHLDHCESNVMFKEHGATVSFYPIKKQPDVLPEELEDLFDFEILLTSGHSEDSISIYFQNCDAAVVGDIVSERGVGRFDLPESNPKKFIKSIEKIQGLDVNYLLPGHGRILEGREGIYLLLEKAKVVLEKFIELR